MDLITWHIGDDGFDMRLSGQVPATILTHLPAHLAALLGQRPQDEVELWAIHPGGRSILDAVQYSLSLSDARWGPRAGCCMTSATCPRPR
jgi:predicted naringenin-chalcone synthase